MKPGRHVIAMEDCPFCGKTQPVVENTEKGTVYLLCQFRDGQAGCQTRIYLGPGPAQDRRAAFDAANKPQEVSPDARSDNPQDRPQEPAPERKPRAPGKRKSIWDKPIF